MLGVFNLISLLKGSKCKTIETENKKGKSEFALHVNKEGYHLALEVKEEGLFREFTTLSELTEYLNKEFKFKENETRALLSIASWDI